MSKLRRRRAVVRTRSGAALRRKLRAKQRALADQMLQRFLASLSKPTRPVYRRDLTVFGAFMRCSPGEAAQRFVTMSDQQAVLDSWAHDLRAQGLAPGTVARRLAALRSYARWRLG